MSNSLSRYAQSPGDRLNPDHDETVLGHLLLEQGRGLQWSIENLAPSAREFRRDTEAAVSATKFTALVGAIAGVIAGTASLPVGLPFAAVAGVSYLAWRSTKAAMPRREAEYQLLKLCPKLPEFLWALHLKGFSPEEVLVAYDDLVERFEIVDDAPEEQAIAKTLWDKVQAMRGAAEFTQTALGSLGGEPAALPAPIPAPQPVAIEPAPMTGGLSLGDRTALIEQIERECPPLIQLIKSHPIRAVGVQRSGKTTLVKIICLLRMLLLEGHSVVAATPHLEQGNSYPSAFRVAGITPQGQRDYDGIRGAWCEMADAVYLMRPANRTYVWDEFGDYNSVFPIPEKGEPDPLRDVLTSCIRETMKFAIYPIFIAHGETAAFLPGSPGLVRPFLASTVRVETVGESVRGDDGLPMIRPTGKFKVTFLDGTTSEGQLPVWLTETYLLGLLGGVQGHGYQGANPQVSAVPFGEPEHPTAAPTQGTGFYYRGPTPQVPQQASNPQVPVVPILEPGFHAGESGEPPSPTAIQPPVGAQVPVPGPGSTLENAIFTPESDSFDADLGEPEPEPGEPRLPPAVFRLKEKTNNYIEAIELVYGVTRGRGKAYKQAKKECDEWLAKQGEQDA
jgi:hypothetical protein